MADAQKNNSVLLQPVEGNHQKYGNDKGENVAGDTDRRAKK
jgi:hypothetical protein